MSGEWEDLVERDAARAELADQKRRTATAVEAELEAYRERDAARADTADLAAKIDAALTVLAPIYVLGYVPVGGYDLIEKAYRILAAHDALTEDRGKGQ